MIRLTDRILGFTEPTFTGVSTSIMPSAFASWPTTVSELVYVPCHRSHMDYLLLTLLYHQGWCRRISPPGST